jgi:glycosyltransferase involved in cell wall biosynthesis
MQKRLINPLVSIIMPNKNGEKYIEQSIKSVINQTYPNWELLITDDGSTDNSLSIIKKYAKSNPCIKLFKNNQGKGPAGARNTSIKKASGSYIAFLDSDDIWLKHHLKSAVSLMEKHNYPFTYSWYELIDEQGKKIAAFKTKKSKISYHELLTNNIISCLTAIYSVKALGKQYLPDIQKRQDYALWLKILKQTKYAYLNAEITAQYRLRKNSVSSNKLKLIKYNWNVYRKIENFSLIKSLYYLTLYILKYFIRKFKTYFNNH